MVSCTYCNSDKVSKRALRTNSSGTTKQRYQCNSCSRWFSKDAELELKIEDLSSSKIKRYVITSCQNNATVNEEFVSSLNSYCSINGATLLIVPILYRPNDHFEIKYEIPEETNYKLVTHKMKIHDEVYVMGSFNFIPTTVNPLQGLESLSKGDTLIVPSPQLRMKSLAVSSTRHPALLHTTGAISNPEYTNTKVGEKALFNHSYSAVVVEIDSDNDFHIRVLSSDETGEFYDLDTRYFPDGRTEAASIEALVTGDEHAIFACPDVETATYTAEDSIVRVLKPKFVVRHDVIDCFSISHHTRKNLINKISKNIFKQNNLEDELQITCDYINRTSECFDGQNIIIASNHTDHIVEWLNNIDIKTEPWNAKIYFWLMYKIIESMKKTDIGSTYDNPFEIYCNEYGVKNTKFITRDKSFMVAGIELSHHGDKGMNGSRGSISQFSNISEKTVIGHSHTPGIIGGAYQVGTSSRIKLEYTTGLSSWLQTHCLIYSNGGRQLINIINGKWRG